MKRVKIKNMKPGTKFRVGSTPCMRIAGLGPTGHVSLITGVINHAILDPDDVFEVVKEKRFSPKNGKRRSDETQT